MPLWLSIFTASTCTTTTRWVSVASFDEVHDLFHAILAGSLFCLILSQAVRYAADWWTYSAVEAFIFMYRSPRPGTHCSRDYS